MKLVRFPNGDNEVLIDPEKVSHIKRERTPDYRRDFPGSPSPRIIVYVLFGGTNEWLEFTDKDAKNVWDYFLDYYTKER